MSEPVEGFQVPVHRALSMPRLVAGIPRDVGVVLFTMAAALAFGLQSWWSVPITLVMYVVALMATKYEPQWPAMLRRALRLKTHYRP
jgi:type IV secretion system protein TrbD